MLAHVCACAVHTYSLERWTFTLFICGWTCRKLQKIYRISNWGTRANKHAHRHKITHVLTWRIPLYIVNGFIKYIKWVFKRPTKILMWKNESAIFSALSRNVGIANKKGCKLLWCIYTSNFSFSITALIIHSKVPPRSAYISSGFSTQLFIVGFVFAV